MTPEHVKALLPVLQAFAEGKTIDVSDPHCAVEFYEYRIKPETVKYRRCLERGNPAQPYLVNTVHCQRAAERVELSSYFIRWIDTEWQEVEV
jgi:hypothetical protein